MDHGGDIPGVDEGNDISGRDFVSRVRHRDVVDEDLSLKDQFSCVAPRHEARAGDDFVQ